MHLLGDLRWGDGSCSTEKKKGSLRGDCLKKSGEGGPYKKGHQFPGKLGSLAMGISIWNTRRREYRSVGERDAKKALWGGGALGMDMIESKSPSAVKELAHHPY